MPNINDIVTIAEALEKSPVVVIADRCAAVRNRNSTCRRCVETCQVGAIDVSGNEVHLSASLCVSCGACSTVCPTEALVPVAPTGPALAQAAESALGVNGDRAVFACARVASKRKADPATYAEVPCLPRIDEATILKMAAEGAREVLLVDGDCSTCKYGATDACTNATLDYARELLAAQGSPTEVVRMTDFPDDLVVEQPEGLHGTTRRGFFSEAIGAARDTTMTAAKTTIAQELGHDASVPAIGERLRVTPGGTLPRIAMPRHDAALDAFFEIGEPQVESVYSRLFASVDIDVRKCNACSMCAVFCPTGALSRDPADKPGDPLKRLEFSASSCVQCGLCSDVCWKHALALDPVVDMQQLFDFEPVVFDLSSIKPKSGNFFNR